MPESNNPHSKGHRNPSADPLEDLYDEIEKAKTIDQCLTLARLYLKRAKDMSHRKPGILES